jgi:hypothetical protein
MEEGRRYANLLALASSLDIPGLLVAARNSPGRVFYSRERDAVQLVGCDGITITANLPIGSPEERILAVAQLPDAERIGSVLRLSWHLVNQDVETRPSVIGFRQIASHSLNRRSDVQLRPDRSTR